MADKFATMAVGRASPGMGHFQIVASNQPISNRPRVLAFETNGSVTIEDASGVSLTYARQAGSILPFSPYKVTAVTGTVYGWV